MKIDNEIREVLEQAESHGTELRLPTQLGRTLYVRIDQLLATAGGHWQRTRKAHVFPGDAAQAVAALLAAGQVQTAKERTVERQFYPTPRPVAERLADLAEIDTDQLVLEPSAGEGALARLLADRGAVVDCIELDPTSAAAIRDAGYAREVITGDFLKRPRRPDYHAVVMNPPFSGRQDLRHVSHAEGFVRPGGKLVAIMSAGVTFRNDRATAQFRQHVKDAGGTIEPLPDDAFHPIGITVRTVVLVLPITGQLTAPPPPAAAPKLTWAQMTGADFGRTQPAFQESLFIPDSKADPLGTEPFDGFGFGGSLHHALQKK
ncbi:hypothetical protein ABT095_20835 [Kitasatospora sp. NPDC002227]|uniref:hypothetical protein n=1 Tax=Kitasatospora sp. NPDC002227 TaxID=3154773 RepID=UPI00331F071F